MDTDGDKKLTVEELDKGLHAKTKAKIEMKIADGWVFDAAKWAASCDRHSKWNMEKVYKSFDVDNDGALTMTEFQRAFRAIGLKKRSGEKIEVDDAMFKAFDTNGDGMVSLKEVREPVFVRIGTRLQNASAAHHCSQSSVLES